MTFPPPPSFATTTNHHHANIQTRTKAMPQSFLADTHTPFLYTHVSCSPVFPSPTSPPLVSITFRLMLTRVLQLSHPPCAAKGAQTGTCEQIIAYYEHTHVGREGQQETHAQEREGNTHGEIVYVCVRTCHASGHGRDGLG